MCDLRSQVKSFFLVIIKSLGHKLGKMNESLLEYVTGAGKSFYWTGSPNLPQKPWLSCSASHLSAEGRYWTGVIKIEN